MIIIASEECRISKNASTLIAIDATTKMCEKHVYKVLSASSIFVLFGTFTALLKSLHSHRWTVKNLMIALHKNIKLF
jgi:hypothetical protein